MPVRFQVDPDFYDHPKTIGLSDAATALWTRAGSYSVAKLLDGYVPESALASLSSDSASAAAELMRRGLWRKARGGYRFHQWEQRNLTRERIEAHRRGERERKERQRKRGRSGENPQVTGGPVPPGLPPGLPRDGRRDSGPMSVSVSVSSLEDSYVGSSPSVPREEDHRVEDEPRSRPIGIKAAILSRVYCDHVKLSDRAKVAGVVMAAIEGGYDDPAIKRGLRLLAKESRPVTPDTLRIAIDGKTTSQPKTTAASQYREGW